MMNHSDEWNDGAMGPWSIIGVVVGVLLVLIVALRPNR